MNEVVTLLLNLRHKVRESGISRILFILMLAIQSFIGMSTFRTNWLISILYTEYYFRYIGILVVLFVLLTQDFKKSELYIYALLLTVLQIISMSRIGFRPMGMYLFGSALLVKNENLMWIAKTVFKTLLLSYVSVILVYLLGIVPTRTSIRLDGTLRNSLGFLHPNTTSGIFMAIVLSYFSILKEKITILPIFIISILYGVIHYFTNTITTLGIMVLLVIYSLITILFPKLRFSLAKFSLSIFNYLAFFLTISSFLLSYFFDRDNVWMWRLNQALNGRLDFGHSFTRQYPINLFGNNLALSGGRFLDNGYINLLLSQGLVYFILVLSVFIFIINRMFRRGLYFMPIIGILIFLWGFMENPFMNLPFNPFLVFGSWCLNDFLEKRNSEISTDLDILKS